MGFSIHDPDGNIVGESATQLEAEKAEAALRRTKDAPLLPSNIPSSKGGGVLGGVAVLFGALFVCLNAGRIFLSLHFHAPFILWPIDTIMAIIHLFAK